MGCHSSTSFLCLKTERWNCCIHFDFAFDTQLSPGHNKLIHWAVMHRELRAERGRRQGEQIQSRHKYSVNACKQTHTHACKC